MPSVDFVVECDVSESTRARQLEALFDVPTAKKCRQAWRINVPFESRQWNVGMIVGPSGSGKTSVARNLFGAALDERFEWKSPSVIDDFSSSLTLEDISAICQAVGFNTIPAWLRPFRVLSNGEQFRVELARRLAEQKGIIVCDEFTSVVDRQVARIGANAVQKHVRKTARQFVAVSCHYDIIDWLQPDWVVDMSDQSFRWRLLQRRPEVGVTISPVPYAAWKMFAPFHYMSASLHRSARCWGLFVEDRIAAFVGEMNRPISRGESATKIRGVSRLVTLPDFQGLGLAFVLVEDVASTYAGVNVRTRTYPAHPALVRSFERSARWRRIKKGGFTSTSSRTSRTSSIGGMGMRPCAVFEFCGDAKPMEESRRMLDFWRRA